jgi:hypothetical protein
MSAVKPGGSIHPVVGSVFSAPRYGRAIDTVPSEEEVVSSRQTERLVIPRPDARQVVTDTEPDSTDPVAASPPRARAPILLPREDRRNEVSRPVADERVFRQPVAREAREPDGVVINVPPVRIDDQSGESKSLEEPSRRRHEEEEVITGVFRPLLPEIDGRTAAAGIQGHELISLASAAGKKERRQMPGQGRKPPHAEPDEIQIHIGRIEVTAVPHAATPQAARPAPRTASLGEYLKRRDTRSL